MQRWKPGKRDAPFGDQAVKKHHSRSSKTDRRASVDVTGQADEAAVASLLASVFGPDPVERIKNDVLACMSASVLRPSMIEDGHCDGQTEDTMIIQKYLSRSGSRRYSPNALFDELWYISMYPDVKTAILGGEVKLGFFHFVQYGIHEGRWPNPVFYQLASASSALPAMASFDEAAYLVANPHARMFLQHFPICTALHYYNNYGRFFGVQDTEAKDPTFHNLMLKEFDHEFYASRYMGGKHSELAFQHYLRSGMTDGCSPNTWFDEHWYRAFYADVRDGIAAGELLSGYQHFLCSGRAERRLPCHDLTGALEARIPNVTVPTLLQRVSDLERRASRVAFRVNQAAPPRIWFILPQLNPDMTFGGYTAAFELMSRLHALHYKIGIVCAEDPHADREYFLWGERKQHIRDAIASMPIVNLSHDPAFEIGPHDRVVVYSVWNLELGAQIAAATSCPRPFLLAQEYEPAFHAGSTIRLICENAYGIDHFPIINSQFLLRYFRAHHVGVFGRHPAPEPFREYSTFEHRIAPLPRQSSKALAARRSRLLVAYARPESHAERNLFEVVVLALRQANREGLFGREWRFVGLGALSDIKPICIGEGRVLEMRQKMAEAEYHEHVRSVDIGISLMYAPHPSVVPFELATTGAIVITNTYENRSADDLRAICRNIVPAAPSIAGVVAAIREALALADDFAAREQNALRPSTTRWDESFSEAFITGTFGPPEPATVATPAAARTCGTKKRLLPCGT